MNVGSAGKFATHIVDYLVRGTLAFLPAVVFLRFAQWSGPVTDDRWMLAFEVVTPFAAAYLLYALVARKPGNRLVIATNLYLLVGGLMVLIGLYGGLRIYGVMRESAVLAFVVAVGIVTTAFSRSGFIATQSVDPSRVRRNSLILLAASIAALAVSWPLQGHPFFAAVLPLMILSFISHRLALQLNASAIGEQS
jgi:hypothetical protein